MKNVQKLLSDNFLFYASYVIRDRAIPHVDDGFKPVQRRILHSLFEMDDGKFHKVSNVVGNTMKYHPHGESSIFMALVLLSNKGLFIDAQGNFGNILTGDEASAPRYIECRINTFAKDTLYYPKITDYIESYDGRNKEPVVFPALLPFSIILGAEGIAVGMSTSIMPHNCTEVMYAVRSALLGKKFELYPDFPAGGIVDISNYADGQGKVLVRASIDIESEKRIIIRELPYGKTTSMLISSLESAVRKGKINISEINDYTAESAEIELKIGRGERAENVIESIYALTDCEISLSLNCLLIKDEKPTRMTITEAVQYHTDKLIKILKRRLLMECDELQQRLHTISLERIFIGKKIYSRLEDAKTAEEITHTIHEGFAPYKSLLNRPLSPEDIEFLLKIPIRRISRYDIDRAHNEEARLLGELKEKKHHLRHLREYAIQCLDVLIKKYADLFPRRTKIETFTKVSERAVSTRDMDIYYDEQKGQLGYRGVAGKKILTVSEFDRLLIVRADGFYTVMPPPARNYVGKIICCMLAEKERLADLVFSIIYTDSNKIAYIKRCQILQYLTGREYRLVPENAKVQALTLHKNMKINLQYQKKARQRKTEDSFSLASYRIKSVKALGVRLSEKSITRASFRKPSKGE